MENSFGRFLKEKLKDTSEIMSSNVFFENGFTYWVDDCNIKSEKELNEDTNYFRARTLSWKQLTEYNDGSSVL